MRKEDLTVTAMDNGYLINVAGRANFDYAVPLRELAEKLTALVLRHRGIFRNSGSLRRLCYSSVRRFG